MPLFDTTTTTDDDGNTVVTVVPETAPDLDTAVSTPNTVPVYPNEPDPKLEAYELTGSPWDTDCLLLQNLGSDGSPARYDSSLSPLDQQYIKVVGYRIMVTEGLNASTDAQQISTITGTGLCWPGTLVNVGDMFVASMVDATKAIFVITAQEESGTAYLNKPSTQITYEFLAYYSSDFETDIARRVGKTRYFDKDHPMTIGVTPRAWSNRINARKSLGLLTSYYWDHFYNRSIGCFQLPSDDEDVWVDLPLNRFICNLIPDALLEQFPSVNQYHFLWDANESRYGSIWDVLAAESADGLPFIPRHMGYTSPAAYRDITVYSGVIFSQVTKILFSSAHSIATADGSVDVQDDYYVFSQAFYEQDTDNMSALEALVLNMLNGQVYNPEDVSSYITNIQSLTDEEQAYQVPVLLWMLKQMLKGDW